MGCQNFGREVRNRVKFIPYAPSPRVLVGMGELSYFWIASRVSVTILLRLMRTNKTKLFLTPPLSHPDIWNLPLNSQEWQTANSAK